MSSYEDSGFPVGALSAGLVSLHGGLQKNYKIFFFDFCKIIFAQKKLDSAEWIKTII
jgi:hypothetical protein